MLLIWEREDSIGLQQLDGLDDDALFGVTAGLVVEQFDLEAFGRADWGGDLQDVGLYHRGGPVTQGEGPAQP